MSWQNVFTSIENILKIITMIGPLIDFIEMLFKRLFPGEKTGEQKKALAILVGRTIVTPEVTDEELGELIDGYVSNKNKTGEFGHTNPET